MRRGSVDTVAGGARDTRGGKHRTEVTEVTEGGLEERLLVDTAAGGARTTRGESIAQRSQRGILGRGCWWILLAAVLFRHRSTLRKVNVA